MQNFNYHTHTYRCGHADLNLKDEEYVEEFIKLGFTKIAFIDHCPEKNDKRPNIRMGYEQRKKLVNVKYPCKEFWEVASNYNIKVLYGIDAHFKEQIQLCKELMQLANKIIGEETIQKLSFIEEF